MTYLSRTTFFMAALVVLALAPAVRASTNEDGGEEERFNAVHHSADSNYLDFSPFGIAELPRLFLVRQADGSLGLDAYTSTASALRSGTYRVKPESHGAGESEDVAAALETGSGDPPSFETMIRRDEHLSATLVPAGGGHVIVDFSMTKHLFFALLAGLIVAGLFISLARRYKRGTGRETAPRGTLQNMMETVIVFIRDNVAKATLGDDYDRYLPFLLTTFFFILTCNLMGLLPFGSTPTADIMVTGVLALFSFFIIQFSASRSHWREVMATEMPWWLRPIMIPIEILGLFTKPFALCVRLFANMTAGHLVILTIVGLIFTFSNMFGAWVGGGVSIVSVAFSLFIALLEILVAFIQAYIFTILSALFIGMAAQEHDHGDDALMDEADPEHRHPEHEEVTPHPISGSNRAGVRKQTAVNTSPSAPA